jgi:polyferredoxin
MFVVFANKKQFSMKAFNLSIGTVVARFYLMMAVVIIAGFIGQWWLTVLALPIFLSIMLGVTFGKDNDQGASIKRMDTPAERARKAG